MFENSPSIQDIKYALNDRLENLCGWLGLSGQTKQGKFTPRNPTRNDKTAGSFVIYMSGAKRGGWFEYAGGVGGDSIALIGYIRGLSNRDAIVAAKGFLGWGEQLTIDPAVLAAQRAKREAMERKAKVDEQRKLAERRKNIHATFNVLEPLWGTAAENYLLGRHIALPKIDEELGDIRFSSLEEYWPLAQRDERGWVIKPAPKLPCMVCAMRNGAGELMSLHRTFLKPDGAGKANVEKAKLIFPASSGAAVHVTNGASNYSAQYLAWLWRESMDDERLALSERLFLVEGIEDALVIAAAVRGARVWAVCGVWNLANIQLPNFVQDVVIAADNDWGNGGAAAGLKKGIDALAAQGVAVRVARSRVGKDFNDWAAAEASA